MTSVVRGQNAYEYSRDGGPKRGPLRPVTAVKYKVTTCRIVRKKLHGMPKGVTIPVAPTATPWAWRLGHPSTRAHIGAFSTKTEMEGWLEREFNSLPPFPDES